jgi:glutathione S-transferase
MAHEVGLASCLEIVHCETSSTRSNDLVYALNPLGKVPMLVTGETHDR